MLSRLMTWLSRLLYPGEYTLEPGRFETFLSGIAEVPDRRPALARARR